MNRNRAPAFKTLLEIIALKHSGYSQLRCQPDHIKRIDLTKPLAVKGNFSFYRIKNFENLFFIGFCVFSNIFFGQRFSGFRLTGGVSNKSGEIPYQKVNFMTKILKMFHLLDQYCMANVQIRCGWIKSSLDLQRFTCFDTSLQFCF